MSDESVIKEQLDQAAEESDLIEESEPLEEEDTELKIETVESGDTVESKSVGKIIVPDGFYFKIEEHTGVFDPDRVKFLEYSESGVGKTVFASTWPRPIYADVDDGMSSISRRVGRVRIKNALTMESMLTYLEGKGHPFKTLVIDSLNELQYYILRGVIKNYPKVRRAYGDLPGQSDYGKQLDDFEQLVRRAKALPINVVFIANASVKVYETDLVGIQLTGRNMPNVIMRMMDIVGYLYKVQEGEGSNDRVMIFDSVNYVTKDRSGVLPAMIKNPTYAMLKRYFDKRQKG